MWGLWQLLWRSVLLYPIAVGLMLLYVGFWMAVFSLPLLIIFFVWISEWRLAVLAVAIWFPMLFLTRWKRIHLDSKDVLNKFENV